ncbi:Stemmadenine O-acetyltransferase, partial [Linum grandiflorum]
LKWSLSETLSDYYPLAGRVRDNFAIHDFHEGVPFVEAQVECHLSDFLHDQGSRHDGVVLLHNLFPLLADCLVPDASPQFLVQMNEFECGGLALGICSLHKSHDGSAANSFLRSWAATNRNVAARREVKQPDYSGGVLTFPPVRSLPPEYTSVLKGMWFGSKGNPVTRRFVFDSESISKLRQKASSQTLENPTRVDALSNFIWKSIISAATSVSATYNSSVLTQTVNLRRLMRPHLSSHSFGNLIIGSKSVYDPRINGQPRLDDMARLVRNGITEMNAEQLGVFVGETGTKAIFNYFDQLSLEMSNDDEKVAGKPSMSCLHGFEMSKIDFGCGPTVWVTRSEPGGASKGEENDNVFYMKDMVMVENNHGGLEAWLTLEEPSVMTALEMDLEFLEFASAKSSILSE